MTYHDAQGNEIEDLEMDKMRREPSCWLCGHTTIYESGLCAFCYFWAEDNTPADASEQEIREAYLAKEIGKAPGTLSEHPLDCDCDDCIRHLNDLIEPFEG